MSTEATIINIKRPVYDTEDLNRIANYEKQKFKFKFKNPKITSRKLYSCLKSVVPIVEWLPNYDFKKYILADILSGLTAAILHIPQGLAYGILADMSAISGIYTSFFPALVYIIFGSSRHNSIGTFAIISLMTSTAIGKFDRLNKLNKCENATTTTILPETEHFTKIQIGTALAFTIAIIQFTMFVLRLGIISTILSNTLISGFTTGAACHTASAQLNDLFGLSIKRHGGVFNIGFFIYEICKNLPSVNWATIIISVIVITLLILNNELLKPWLSKKTKIPVPAELIVLILGDVISYFANFEENYDIHTVGHIPVGFPIPEVPPLKLFGKLIVDALAITAVSYAITMSLGLTFSKKCMTELDANQELFAMGACNIFGSFFGCIPICSSLARTTVQVKIGNMSQISTVVSCAVLLLLILWIGPFFEYLPRTILSCVIIVSLKNLFMQFKDLPRFWKLSKLDALIWILTFSTVVLLDVDYGLMSGVFGSILVIFYLNCKPETHVLGESSGFYLNKKEYNQVQEIEGMKIIYFGGDLNFGTIPCFNSSLKKYLHFDVRQFIIENQKKKRKNKKFEPDSQHITFKCIILEMSGLKSIDPSGIEFLETLYEDFRKINVEVILSGIIGENYNMLCKYKEISKKKLEFRVFPTTHDAVNHTKYNIL